MGGYVKRCMGLNLYFKVENPKGQRIQELFVQGKQVRPDKVYTAAFVTMQGVAAKYGTNRQTWRCMQSKRWNAIWPGTRWSKPVARDHCGRLAIMTPTPNESPTTEISNYCRRCNKLERHLVIPTNEFDTAGRGCILRPGTRVADGKTLCDI